MLKIPFPLVFLEIIIFWLVVGRLGILNTLLIYFMPCLLGILIVSTWGRVALVSLQMAFARGEVPGKKVLHAGAIFIGGICLAVPSFFARILGIALLLPGLRHLMLWKFKANLLQKMAQGSTTFNFSGFRFGGGAGPFTRDTSYTDFGSSTEREVFSNNVIDIKPIEIIHKTKKSHDEN